MSPVRDMLFITHESAVFVLVVSVTLHMSIISQDGWSALMWAAGWGHTEVVKQLLEAGANTDLQTTEVHTNHHDATLRHRTTKKTTNFPLFSETGFELGREPRALS